MSEAEGSIFLLITRSPSSQRSSPLFLPCSLPPELTETCASTKTAKLQKSAIDQERAQVNTQVEELREGQAKSSAKLQEELTMKETHCTLLDKKAENLNGKIAKVCVFKTMV